jgi:replicative DNA helicase
LFPEGPRSDHKHAAFVSSKTLVKDFFKTLEYSYAGHRAPFVMPTGFTLLDAILEGGFQDSELIILTGDSGTGKTTLVLDIARHVATESANRAVAVFSPGTPGRQVIARMMAAQSNVPQCILNTGLVKENHWPKITVGGGRLSDGIYVDDTAGILVSELIDSTRELRKTLEVATRLGPRLGLLVVDDLQLIRSSRGPDKTKGEEYEDICRLLKLAARELDVPVLLVSPLKAKQNGALDRGPQPPDFCGLGVIEPYADIILDLQRDGFSATHPDGEEGDRAEIVIVKNKRGPLATVKLHFLDLYPTFRNFNGELTCENGPF